MAKQNESHLAIATGGTGGHFFPALSVAREYRRKAGPVSLLIGGQRTKQHLDMARRHGINAIPIPMVKPARSKIQLPWFALQLGWAFYRSRAILRRLQVSRVLGMGGFASVPVGMAAVIERKPLYLHEGNAIIGRANRFLQRRARLLMLSMPLKYPESAKCPTLETGFPLRSELIAAARSADETSSANRLRQELGFDPELTTMLIFGGSQGAAFFNQLAEKLCQTVSRRNPKPHFQVIQLTGCQECSEQLKKCFSDASIPAYITNWSDRMEDFYKAADLVLCRGGAATIAELALFKKSAIIVPLPTAMEGHQTANAEVLAQANAAILVKTEEATEQRILHELQNLIDKPEIWRQRSSRLGSMAMPKAAESVVSAIIQ